MASLIQSVHVAIPAGHLAKPALACRPWRLQSGTMKTRFLVRLWLAVVVLVAPVAAPASDAPADALGPPAARGPAGGRRRRARRGGRRTRPSRGDRPCRRPRGAALRLDRKYRRRAQHLAGDARAA